jgi:hypothetical protein
MRNVFGCEVSFGRSVNGSGPYENQPERHLRRLANTMTSAKEGTCMARCGCGSEQLILVSEVALVSLRPRRKH